MGCGCFLALLAFFFPRIVVILLWIFSDWFTGVFDNVLWPVLGFFFLPTTLFWYTAVQHWYGGEWTFIPIVGIVIALIIDVSPAKARRQRGG